jgi:redox-sensitive bicupin YhaK (pirin superfamily)
LTQPRYQEVKSPDIPEVTDDDGTRIRVVAGEFWGRSGPVDGIATDPVYLDVSIPPLKRKSLPVETSRHAFAYVISGGGRFGNASDPRIVRSEEGQIINPSPTPEAADRSLIVFDRGDEVSIEAGPEGIRFLLVSGKPLGEPVAWWGPIVMNTQAELQQAISDLEQGTFLHDR